MKKVWSLWFGALLLILTIAGLVWVNPWSILQTDGSETLAQIKREGKIRLGMYLSFEGLSFIHRGKLTGLEVALADILCAELSKGIGTEIKPEIIDQEWGQIVKVLRDGKYHAAFSAVIPSPLYDRYQVRYSQPYLNTGPVICCQARDGKPAKDVTAEAASLSGKRVVVINDPAVRRVLRRAGIYVSGDGGRKNVEKAFPKNETVAEMKRAGRQVPLVSVREIIQLDEMLTIYKMIANGKVDAGVIDLGIIWWVANESRRWSKKIHAFPKPIGPYIYCAVTRREDDDLGNLLDLAIERMLQSPKFQRLCHQWHGPEIFNWGSTATDYMK